ncbi:MAG: hypothetical protein COB15_11865 [Flavobacteriales bacterium]|nr:MAG: hypothetical protein COB15_11865 [Flavobacteriales bacterium]
MKKLFFIAILFYCSFSASAQIHWLVNSDSIPNCELIKSGKFVNKETDCKVTPDYYIVYSNGFVTDFVNDGKYYVKSKLTFKSECKWESEIVEVTIPESSIKVGSIIITEVIETATIDNLVKIDARNKGDKEGTILVLQKIE